MKMIKMSIWKYFDMIYLIQPGFFFQLQGQHNLLRQSWPPSHCINEIYEFTTGDGTRENPWKKAVTGSKQLLPELTILAAVQLLPEQGCAGRAVLAPEAGAAPSPIPGSAAKLLCQLWHLDLQGSPLEKECIDISQIPVKASRGLAWFIISSSLKHF